MTRMRTIGLLIVCAHFFIFLGCEKPPTDVIIRAERMIEAAQNVQADAYAPETFLSAEKAIKKARDHVASKEYGRAKESAMEAAQFAQEAIVLARAEKTRLREEADKMAQQIDEMLKELRAYAGKSDRRRSRSKTEEIQAVIAQYETDLAAGREKLQENEILQAHSDLTILRDRVSDAGKKLLNRKDREGGLWK